MLHLYVNKLDFTLFRLKTQTVLAGRLAKMFGAVATEVGKSRKIAAVLAAVEEPRGCFSKFDGEKQ